jgi:hypothetical protein
VDKFCLFGLSQPQSECFGFQLYFGHTHAFFCAACSGHSLTPFEFHQTVLYLVRISAGNIQHLCVSFIKWPIGRARFQAARAEHSANIFSIIYTGVCEKNAIFHYFFQSFPDFR